jgi:hypothetical protein
MGNGQSSIAFNALGLVDHELNAPVGLLRCAKIFDVGAGLRPVNWYKPAQHICIEPHKPYADRLKAAGYEVRNMEALDALANDRADAVYMLDVIEHMPREIGQQCIDVALSYADQVIIFTPNGFLPQHGDAWGLGGEYWQEHRSGWTPEDFPGWNITHRGKCFMAVWSRP